jgi:hypothetical protein
MTEHDVQLLKDNDQKIVRLRLTDGEVVTAKVLFVSESEQDVIVDLLSSTNITRYPKDDEQPAFQYRFRDIVTVEPIANNLGPTTAQ